MTRTWLCAAVLVAASVAAGCASSAERSPASVSEPGDASPAAESTSGTLQFGQTHHGDIDKTVRKGQPFEVTTSPYAAPQGGASAWVVEYTFVNNTSMPFTPMMFQVGATVDGRAAEEVFDGALGYNGLLTTPPIGPGQAVTVPVAYTGAGSKHVVTIASGDMTRSVTFSD